MRTEIKARITQMGEVCAEIKCAGCNSKITGSQLLNLTALQRAFIPQIANLEIRIPVVAEFRCEKCVSVIDLNHSAN
jgi:hypothetical protein